MGAGEHAGARLSGEVLAQGMRRLGCAASDSVQLTVLDVQNSYSLVLGSVVKTGVYVAREGIIRMEGVVESLTGDVLESCSNCPQSKIAPVVNR